MTTTRAPSATARAVTRTPGGYVDQFTATVSVLNDAGICVGDREFTGRLYGLPFNSTSFRDRGLHGASVAEIESIALAVELIDEQ